MLKLFGHTNKLSINSFKLRVALAEADAAYEYVPVDLNAGEQRKPDFLLLNPHGKVPVLQDGDFVLPESDAILWYIAERFLSARLLGDTPGKRARTLQWMDFASTALYPAYADIYTHTVSNPPEKRLGPVAELGQQRLNRALVVMEAILGQRDYLADSFSIADLGTGAVLRSIQDRIPFDAAAYPKIMAWYARLSGRPSWQVALASAKPA